MKKHFDMMTVNVFSVGAWLVSSNFLETVLSKHNLFAISLNSIVMNIRKVVAFLWHIWYLRMHYLPRVFNLIKNVCVAYLSWCISNRSCPSQCGSYLSDSTVRFIRCPEALGSSRKQCEGEAAPVLWLWRMRSYASFELSCSCILNSSKRKFFFS